MVLQSVWRRQLSHHPPCAHPTLPDCPTHPELPAGGALSLSSTHVTMNGTTLSGNQAQDGGVVFAGLNIADLAQQGVFAVEMNNCTASHNR